MKYCRTCLQPDTRPNTKFNKNGICPACDYYSHFKNVDWQERSEILQELMKDFPKNAESKFDCIIGVSGGKDSTRQALWVREKLNMRTFLLLIGF